MADSCDSNWTIIAKKKNLVRCKKYRFSLVPLPYKKLAKMTS